MARAQTTTDTAESAVRRYLTYLEDPSKLVDAANVKKLKAAVAKATDPLERLRALTALSTAKAPESDELEKAFIRHAESWAKAEGIPAASFAEMKVPRRVLDAAFSGNGGSKRGRKPAGVVRSRRSRTSADEVEKRVLGIQGDFTVRDAIEASGASPVTVKTPSSAWRRRGRFSWPVSELVLEGGLRKPGRSPDPPSARGRCQLVAAMEPRLTD